MQIYHSERLICKSSIFVVLSFILAFVIFPTILICKLNIGFPSLLTRAPDFSVAKFDDRTILLCDQVLPTTLYIFIF